MAGKVRVRVILLGCIVAILTLAAIQQHIVGRSHMEENVHITTYLQQTGDKPPEGITYDEIIKKSAEFAYKDGIISRPIKGDFPLFGKPYSALSEMEYSVGTSIARERHFCLNWLCGYSKDWDKVPTDT